MTEKMKNGNKIKQRTGNEVIGTVRVQVSFCIEVFIFPVPRARCTIIVGYSAKDDSIN